MTDYRQCRVSRSGLVNWGRGGALRYHDRSLGVLGPWARPAGACYDLMKRDGFEALEDLGFIDWGAGAKVVDAICVPRQRRSQRHGNDA